MSSHRNNSSFAGHLLGFISEGKVFGKVSRIMELDRRMCRWLVELWPFWTNPAHFGMVWKISSPCTSWMTKLCLNVKTDDVTSDTRDMDPHGWLIRAALKHGIRNPETEREMESRKRKRKQKWNTESNVNDRKLKNFTLHNLVQSKENLS